MPAGRPTAYNHKVIAKKAWRYLESCKDEEAEFHATRGEKSDSFQRIVRVRIPTIEGLSVALGVHRDTMYLWEKKFPEFYDIIEKVRRIQADRLIENGLSGDYNPTIAKVLLTKHGYREGIDSTTNDKDLPTPILNVSRDNGDKKDISTEEED